MAIPEAQLSTWSSQGAVPGSATTYATIKRALEADTAGYKNRNFAIFLQGSYGNDTNIYAESDVDVVIRYDGGFHHDITSLPPAAQQAFNAHFSDGDYPYRTFKEHVEAALRTAFGDAVDPGNKAIKVKANGSRRSADVVVAFEFRRYHRFNGSSDQSHALGICFFAKDGTRIANYPKQHSENLTTKHQATNGNFKPVVRIFKNMRSRMVDTGTLGKGVARSYYIEGLLYNVPNDKFQGTTWAAIVLNVLRWLRATTDRSNFLCANEQYYLLRDGYPTCWPTADGAAFIQAACDLWDNWQ